MQHRSNLLVSMLVLSCAASGSWAAAPAAPASEPAEWLTHDMIIDLHDLPKRYSCDDLWYRFHDVLLAIGARPETLQVLAYRCEPALGPDARSPSVHLKFELPSAVQGAATRYADVRVESQLVRLSPGHPRSLNSGDCTLLKEIKSELLDVLGLHVVGFNLACAAAENPHFQVSAEALTPVNAGQRQAAAAGARQAAAPVRSASAR